VIENLLNPAILFFALGFLATAVKSDLEIPQPISKFLSLYLLMSIGLKGGVQIAANPVTADIVRVLLAAIGVSALIPIAVFLALPRRYSVEDRAAIGATYGSVSAVTFVTAVNYLGQLGIVYGGHMVAAMALMEAPAIIVALWLYKRYTQEPAHDRGHSSMEAFTNASVFLILGALLIGVLADPGAMEGVRPFTESLFQGMLMFFLLDMGLLASRRIEGLKDTGLASILAAFLIPLAAATLGIGLSWVLKLSLGDAFLLTVLSASASYIAVPAAIRVAIPKANAGLYVPMALAITFPLNLLVGFPLYLAILRALLGDL
jgi:uncharacterized protein